MQTEKKDLLDAPSQPISVRLESRSRDTRWSACVPCTCLCVCVSLSITWVCPYIIWRWFSGFARCRQSDVDRANCVKNDSDSDDDNDDNGDEDDDADDPAQESFDFSDVFIAVAAASVSGDACYRGRS